MPSETVVETEVKQENSVQPISTPPKEDDIVRRVADFKLPETNVSKPSEPHIFDASTFDKISSVEEAKKYAQSAHKELERTFQKKFQDIAELRKTLESQINNGPTSWTTEKVRKLMQEPSFITAANDVLKSTSKPATSEEYSALSDEEKQRLIAAEEKTNFLLKQQQELLLKQEDEQLKSKYPNYNSVAVDTITADLLTNKITNTREYIWKASDYESAVKRAYQLGKQDALKQSTENSQGESYTGISSTVDSASPKREKNESNENFLRRLYSRAVQNTTKTP